MSLDPTRYTGRHAAPHRPSWVQLLAYERKSGGWDLFVFEPPGVCPPEWEGARVDSQHLQVGELSSLDRFDEAVDHLHEQLGPTYEPVLAWREPEPGKRVGLNRRLQHLHHAGATGYQARRGADGHWELWARRKDLEVVEKVR